MLTYFPPIRPYAQQMIMIGENCQLYVEESGCRDGIPVVFLHGGPGRGSEPDNRRFFDPEEYRIILFDQRGCGRSEPHDILDGNTLPATVSDMEVIREALGVEQWVIFGGGWGSTLALLYAQTHPERALGVVVWAVQLCRTQDLQWQYQGGAREVYPDHWRQFVQPIDEDERGDVIKAYYQRLTGEDEVTRMAVARAWTVWLEQCATLQPNPAALDHKDPRKTLAMARIGAHYCMHRGFLEDNQLLRDVARMQGIPGVIVHGRYDIMSPLSSAWALHHAWPESELNIIRDAGHAETEPGVVAALVRAAKSMLVFVNSNK